MFNIKKESIEWQGKTLTIETGRIARQANGAVLLTYGNTQILAAVVGEKEAKADASFFPLTVNYFERFYAAGKFPGGFFKREGQPTEHEKLVSRLIDRPIRPMFAEGFCNEVQITCKVISLDVTCVNADILGLIAASAALAISDIPFSETIAAAKVAYIDGQYVVNPTAIQAQESELDLVVAGTKDSVLMVESEASNLSEEVMLGAVMAGLESAAPVIEMINKLQKAVGKKKWEFSPVDNSDLKKQITNLVGKEIATAYKIHDKLSRKAKLDEIHAKVDSELKTEDNELMLPEAMKSVEKTIVRQQALSGGRIDGRSLDQVRQIECELDLLHATHGSALFTRGETQSLAVVTLGTERDEQTHDNVGGETKERFILHYNFPPYSVGECGRVGSPGRREIGHGKLAWRALKSSMPNAAQFPYTVRLVSEITESNGSSSMATVCSGSLAMMASGVPLKSSVAGIAMGLIKEGKDFVVLSDIMGDEDHLGDMDFKVAGSAEGITALQMDIKIKGISKEIMEQALSQAKTGRMHILDIMDKTISESRKNLSGNAPRITEYQVKPDQIRIVIGPGGKNIKHICEEAGVQIDLNDSGLVKIASNGHKPYEKAVAMIEELLSSSASNSGGNRPGRDDRRGGGDRDRRNRDHDSSRGRDRDGGKKHHRDRDNNSRGNDSRGRDNRDGGNRDREDRSESSEASGSRKKYF